MNMHRCGEQPSAQTKKNKNHLGSLVQELRTELESTKMRLEIETQERKRAEDNEERMQALMNHNPSLVFLKDEYGRYVYLNEAYEKRFVFTKDWYGKSDFDFWPPESARLFRSHDKEVLRSSQPRQFLEDITGPEGARYCWLCYKFPFTDKSGGKYLGGIGIDISDRVKAEEAYRASEERFRTYVKTSWDVVFRMSPDWKEMQELENKNFISEIRDPGEAWVDRYILRDDQPRLQALIMEAIRTKNTFEAEYRVVRKDGAFGWMYTRAIPIVDKNGVLVEWFGTAKDITARKAMEEALRENEERYRSLAENIPSVLMRYDRNLRVVYLSRRAEKITGIPSYKFVGRTNREAGMPEHLCSLWEAAIAEVFRTGDNQNLEFDLSSQKGIRTFYLKLSPEFGSEGEVAHVLGISTEITEQKRAVQKIRLQNAVLNGTNRIFREAIAGKTEEELAATCLAVAEELTGSRFGFIGLINPEGGLDHVVISNPGKAECKMTGPEGGRGSLRRGLPIRGLYGRVIRDGKTFFTNDPSSHPDSIGTPEGHPKLTSFLGVPLIDDGRIIGMVALANRTEGYGDEDIVIVEPLALAMMEALKRKRIQVALRESENLLRAVMENSRDAVYVKDREARWLMANPAVLRMLGKTLNQTLGNTARDLYADQVIGRIVLENDLRLIATGMEEAIEEPADTPGGRRTFLSIKVPRRDAEGKVIGLIGISRDITEQKHAEKEIKDLNLQLAKNVRELRAANKELEAFIYSVSHDLRAPLRAISGFAQVLNMEHTAMLNEQGRDYLGRVAKGSQKMNLIIEALLNLSRISRRALCRQNIDITSLANSVLTGLRDADPERNVTVHVAEGVAAYADPELLEIALSNILGNAWKFTAKRADAVIEAGMSAWNGNTLYYIKDNGVGFDQAYARKLFMPFQRLHHEDEFEGSGIGMAITERIIRRHGGKIWAEGKKGEGACFYFVLE